MKKLFFRFDFSPKIKKFLTTLHNTQERAILWIIRQFLPFLFPRHCPLCDKLLPYGSFIHEECHRELPLIHSPVCMRCGKPVSSHTQEYCYDCRAFPKSFQRGLSLFLYNIFPNYPELLSMCPQCIPDFEYEARHIPQ